MKLSFKSLLVASVLATPLALVTSSLQAADYVIDSKDAHASINFKASHLGFSWLLGRFNRFEGEFSFDEKNPDASRVQVTIDTTSLDSNHAERDKHLKSDDFLNAAKFPEAIFKSSSVHFTSEKELLVKGDFSLNGVTKPIEIQASKVGEGKDPWGGYRLGFSGTTQISMADYQFKNAWGDVVIELHIEGIRK